MTHKYTLQPYTTPSSRYQCPRCRHRNKTFVRYINTETGQHLAEHVGRCGRENSCGYHFKPKAYFEAEGRGAGSRWSGSGGRVRGTWRPGGRRFTQTPAPRTSSHTPGSPPPAPVSTFLCINPEIVNASFRKYGQNNFVQYLIATFGFDKADELVGRYRIGTAKHWQGATVFWQLDTDGKVCTGKVMLYNAQTGKRVKKPFNHITWAHTLLVRSLQLPVGSEQTADCPPETANLKFRQCLFGLHLLNDHPTKGIAIVESEKTAIIASARNDTLIWMAIGGLSNLNAEILKPLTGRSITLYPDLGAYDKWKAKAHALRHKLRNTIITVSDLVERKASELERKQGLDIADLL